MTSLLNLSRPALETIAKGLESGRLTLPIDLMSLTGYVPSALKQEVYTDLNDMAQMGMSEKHIAYTLTLLAKERASSQSKTDQIELVWTGEEFLGSESRDTSIVVKELFQEAKSSVLISSYAIDKGVKGQEIFQILANRMDIYPDLQVRMFLNIQRPYRNTEAESILIRKFAETFRNEVWTGKRLPQVFHDPRSLAEESKSRACLHAKCIVVDEEIVFVTSANFTEAAHERNIEAGILLRNPVVARAMRSQFEMLATGNLLQRVPGL